MISKVFGVERPGRDLFRAAEQLDLEASWQRKMDPYAHSTVWLKVENRAYTQMEGRGELFHPKPRQAESHGSVPPEWR